MGARWFDSAKELTAASEVIISLVSNDEASQSVWFDPQHGAIHALTNSKLAIECSTISHAWSLEIARKLSHFHYLEAPLVGSRPQAEAKQLTLLVGGDASCYERAKNLLLETSANVLHIGEHGKAITLKLVINSLLGIQTAAFAELYTTLLNSGFDKKQIVNTLPKLPVTSPVMQVMLNYFVEEQFDPQFPIDLVEKDFSYARDLIAGAGINPEVVGNTHDIYKSAKQAGFGQHNISGILNYYKSRK